MPAPNTPARVWPEYPNHTSPLRVHSPGNSRLCAGQHANATCRIRQLRAVLSGMTADPNRFPLFGAGPADLDDACGIHRRRRPPGFLSAIECRFGSSALGASIAAVGPLHANCSQNRVATPYTWYVTHHASLCSGPQQGCGRRCTVNPPEAQSAHHEQGPAPSSVAALDAHGHARLFERLRVSVPVQADGTIALRARAWTVCGRRG